MDRRSFIKTVALAPAALLSGVDQAWPTHYGDTYSLSGAMGIPKVAEVLKTPLPDSLDAIRFELEAHPIPYGLSRLDMIRMSGQLSGNAHESKKR